MEVETMFENISYHQYCIIECANPYMHRGSKRLLHSVVYTYLRVLGKNF